MKTEQFCGPVKLPGPLKNGPPMGRVTRLTERLEQAGIYFLFVSLAVSISWFLHFVEKLVQSSNACAKFALGNKNDFKKF